MPSARKKPFEDFREALIYAPQHTKQVFDPLAFRDLIKKTTKTLREIRLLHPNIQAIAATGHSGLCFASALSYTSGLPMLAVRRNTNETEHDSRIVNGYIGAKEYIIVDDLISSGCTLRRLIRSVEKGAAAYNLSLDGLAKEIKAPRLAAILLYMDNWHEGRAITITLDGKSIKVPIYGPNNIDQKKCDIRKDL